MAPTKACAPRLTNHNFGIQVKPLRNTYLGIPTEPQISTILAVRLVSGVAGQSSWPRLPDGGPIASPMVNTIDNSINTLFVAGQAVSFHQFLFSRNDIHTT